MRFDMKHGIASDEMFDIMEPQIQNETYENPGFAFLR